MTVCMYRDIHTLQPYICMYPTFRPKFLHSFCFYYLKTIKIQRKGYKYWLIIQKKCPFWRANLILCI